MLSAKETALQQFPLHLTPSRSACVYVLADIPPPELESTADDGKGDSIRAVNLDLAFGVDATGSAPHQLAQLPPVPAPNSIGSMHVRSSAALGHAQAEDALPSSSDFTASGPSFEMPTPV